MGATQAKFKGRPFVGISILTENKSRQPPSSQDLEAWKSEHSLTGEVPVLNDSDKQVFSRFFPGDPSGSVLLKPGLEIVVLETMYENTITDQAIETLLQ